MFKRFTAAQKRGALILLLLIGLFVGWRFRSAYLANRAPVADSLQTANAPADTTAAPASKTPLPRVELNSADSMGLIAVRGIGPYFAHRILTYRRLAGGIEHRDELLDVGFKMESFLNVEPQVYADTSTAAFGTLRQAARARATAQKKRFKKLEEDPEFREFISGPGEKYGKPKPRAAADGPKDTTAYAQKAPPPSEPIDLNTADSTLLVTVPGVGPWTARKILWAREKLLFFHAVTQLQDEVKNLRPENFERMQPFLKVSADLADLPHIHINEWDVRQLAAHKFIDWKVAKRLVAYREQHGPFQSVDDLKKILEFPEGLPEKLRVYLAF